MCLRRTASIALAITTVVGAGSASGGKPRDLYFGEALYCAYQEHYFEALERLDAEIGRHYMWQI